MSSKHKQTSDSMEDGFDLDDSEYYTSARVNLDLDPDDKCLTPEQIASLFIEIAQRAEKCFDFQISTWLKKYEALRQHPNFAEAALLISSASKIYARKINYLEDMVMQLIGAGRDDKLTSNTETDQTKVVRRRGKKFRMNTIADSFSDAEFIVKEFEQLPSVKLTEMIKKKKVNYDSHWEKFKAFQCRFLKNKKNKLIVSKKLTTDNSEIIATNAIFGKNPIYEYDEEEIIGNRNDFRCFSSILNDNCELISDYNFTTYFQHVDMVNKDEQEKPSVSQRNLKTARKFKFYISNEYLKQNYGIEIENPDEIRNDEIESDALQTSLTLEKNVSEFSDMIQQNLSSVSNDVANNVDKANISSKSIVSVDSAYQSLTEGEMSFSNKTLESIPEELQETFYDAVDTEENMEIDHELTEYNLIQKSREEETLKSALDPDNHSLLNDEGISVRSPSIQSPNHLSETGSEMNVDMIFQPGSSFMFNNIKHNLSNVEENNPEEVIQRTNLFGIQPVYLEHKEDFDLPLEYLIKTPQLIHNFLCLPEQRLRKKCLFALPPDEYKPRPIYLKLPIEPPTPKIYKMNMFKNGELNDKGNIQMKNGNISDEEDFAGFDEDTTKAEFEQGLKSIFTSTPNKKQINSDEENILRGEKRNAEEPAMNPPNEKRTSLDSNVDPEELITDDEDSENKTSKNGENNLSTPERIKAAQRVSRDSGITSPEPEETLTITVTDKEENNQSINIELNHPENDDESESVKSFCSATDGPDLPTLSNHDQKLTAQAQQKYQQQITDMQSLVVKVNNWHQYLKPILKDSQTRSTFDIHECGTEVLDVFQNEADQNEISFADVMSTKPDDHIARYFLATLMLVNTGNIELINTNKDVNRVSSTSELQLKLKSRVRLHEELENMNETVPCISSNSSGKKRKVCGVSDESDGKTKKFKKK
uniref:CSON007016 protein n=1 Tax=Culicoides sonorensis TaxID=179676 RepID=A0A336MWE1_CULSO